MQRNRNTKKTLCELCAFVVDASAMLSMTNHQDTENTEKYKKHKTQFNIYNLLIFNFKPMPFLNFDSRHFSPEEKVTI